MAMPGVAVGVMRMHLVRRVKVKLKVVGTTKTVVVADEGETAIATTRRLVRVRHAVAVVVVVVPVSLVNIVSPESLGSLGRPDLSLRSVRVHIC